MRGHRGGTYAPAGSGGAGSRVPVAIVGLGAILPDAPTAPAYWQNIRSRRYSITEVPRDRWRVEDYYDPDPSVPDKTYSKIGAWVRGFTFDWKGFRIPPKVAAAMDEGQQWAVSIAAEALADYGYPARPLDTERTGVVFGAAMGGELHYITGLRIFFPEYANALASVGEFQALPEANRTALVDGLREAVARRTPGISEDSMPGELANVIAGRVANVFNFRGPNFIADAACASSFAALESGCDLLAQRKADAVLCGGVDRNMGPSTFVKFCKIGALSATGTRPFGEGADGFVMGEGAAAFLLKRLDDAERDGDKIYAVVRGVGAASDGKGKGITAPNPQGQILAVRRAWEDAGLDPATCTLVEAHGTSTKVGDVVEVSSLTDVFCGAPRGSIGLGSAKSNIGHLKAGAGAAGLLKAVCAMYQHELPPTLNAERPNPAIDFAATPFRLIHQPEPWEPRSGLPRRCGVSAYGFGGTNFHIVLEEYVKGTAQQGTGQQGSVRVEPHGPAPAKAATKPVSQDVSRKTPKLPPTRGILALGAETPAGLAKQLDELAPRISSDWLPPEDTPEQSVLTAPERLLIDYGSREELLERTAAARQALDKEQVATWRALVNRGIFRGQGKPAGKMAFLFPGQGSQYANMGRTFLDFAPVAETFAEADRVLEPILGKPLTSFMFCDPTDQAAVRAAEEALRQTAITQPAVLTVDTALHRLLTAYGFRPDMVMGHSLGEYAALVAAGVLPFAHALEAAAARGAEMTRVSMEDNGWMAAVMAPLEVVQAVLAEIDGYVVPANINSNSQCVIGGASRAVEDAIAAFSAKGFQAQRIPVSHAFHTAIVAPASAPLRQVLNRLDVQRPQVPVVSNVTGELHPDDPEAIKELLERQIASPVQWVLGLETLYAQGCRAFVEVGPKRALKGFVDEGLGTRDGVISTLTCHPKTGEAASFNQALCSLWAAGYGVEANESKRRDAEKVNGTTFAHRHRGPRNGQAHVEDRDMKAGNGSNGRLNGGDRGGNAVSNETSSNLATNGVDVLAQALTLALDRMAEINAHPAPVSGAAPTAATAPTPWDRTVTPAGSVVISGTGLGLPGTEKRLMDPDNALRVLRGEPLIDLVPERFRREMLAKRITRLVKAADGGGSFQVITDPDDVIRLAGRKGAFDLVQEYGVPQKLVETLDITSQLAIAAGLDALREAGIPLVQTWRPTSTGKHLPDRWMIPAAMRDETGVIFASAFPGGAALAEEIERYYRWENRLSAVAELEDLRRYVRDFDAQAEICRRIAQLREEISAQPYEFDRRFLFRILSMGHSQFAEYIGARGPNTQVNAACATTTQAIALAEDWIRSGRCRRVLVIAGDDVTGDSLMEWVGAGFLALGAAATEDRVSEAALPFDRRRHGTIAGMGACALVVESEDAVRERGMRGIVEILSTETANSAFHGSRLDPDHIGEVMEGLVSTAEKRFGVNRYSIAPYTVFVSHETYTPARGGSASAEVVALRKTFGEAARHIVVSNTKGFTGHPMGVGVEDVLAVKMLEHGVVPPVPNFQEVDPDLGVLNLSRGGNYPVAYALHLAAGFGSQIAMTFLRRVPGGPDRIGEPLRYQHWLDTMSGYDRAQLETVKRVLRVQSQDGPGRSPAPSQWRRGLGPSERATAPGDGVPGVVRPAPMWKVAELLEGKAGAAPEAMSKPSEGESSQARREQQFKRQSEKAPELYPNVVRPAPSPAVQAVVVAEAPSTKAEPEVAHKAAVSKPTTSAAPAPSVPPAVELPSGFAGDPLTARVLEIVAAKTGYPQDMLDLELDLEADLGIDTVKQAETFAAIRQAYDIPPQQGLSLRDYPTLKSVVGFVHKMRPDLVIESAERVEAGKVEATPVAEQATAPSGADPITSKVLEIVAAKTGYPQDMLDLELDLEADLGIDTVKQAETFAAIRQAYDIPPQQGLSLRDYPTLKSVVGFVRKMRPDLAAESAENAARVEPPSAQPSAPSVPSVADPITSKVLEIVAAKTGYPQDMLDLELDLEADLGIDTVKQAETFAAIRQAYDIPPQQGLSLRDYPTLKSVVGFVHKMRPDLVTESAQKEVAVPFEQPGAEDTAPPPVLKPALQTIGSLEDADRIPRRVPRPALRPPLEACKPTGVVLGPGSRVVVMLDEGCVGTELAHRLAEEHVEPLLLEPGMATVTLVEKLHEWRTQGPIHGVYWLPALDIEPPLEELSPEEWRELNRRRVKNLYAAMRELYDVVAGPGAFLISGTRFGGLHGYGEDGATAPLGGAVTGFTKAYAMEQGLREAGKGVLVKTVDVDHAVADQAARWLIAETLVDPAVIEVGYRDCLRYTVNLQEEPARDGGPGVQLGPESVVLVTGAAGGITSAIVGDLAAASGACFYLLDLAPLPPRDEENVARFRQGRDVLKQALIDAARQGGRKAKPAEIDRQIAGVERQSAALAAVEAVEAAGGKALYRSLDLRDFAAVQAVIDEIRTAHGRIDLLVHAAGLLIDKTLPDKQPEQFDLVFDVKADGFFNLLKASQGMPIGATVAFSSVAGRFGNNGQADYSAANDLLCKLTNNLPHWRPETRAIAIDWTAWGGIGMAARGSVPQIMEALGVDMLPPEAGVPTVRRELTYGGTRGEVVIAGRLGAWLEERDLTGGLDPEKADVLLTQKSRLPMLGRLTRTPGHGGLEIETTLDPKSQPFLCDHAPDPETPWLPGVMAIEGLAEAAQLLAPGYRVAAVENVRMLGAFKFFRMEPRTLHISGTIRPAGQELLAEMVLRSVTQPVKAELPAQVKEHFRATVRLIRDETKPSAVNLTVPGDDLLTIGSEEVYASFFHGPAYRVVGAAAVDGNKLVARFAHDLPPAVQPADAPLLMAPRLLELCFQAAALWSLKTGGAMAFPAGLEKLTVRRQEPAAGAERVWCSLETGDGGTFDGQVVDDAGNVYVELKGYNTIARPA